MTKESTITNVGSVPNVIDTTTVRFKGGELPGGYYELPTYQPGTLTITPNTDEVTVTITGNHDTRVYNGSEQSVTGYDGRRREDHYRRAEGRLQGGSEGARTPASTTWV